MKVAWLHVAPVKGLVIQQRDDVMLGVNGVDEDRRFCLVDETGRMLNGKRFAPVATFSVKFDPVTERLELLIGGETVSGLVTVGEPTEVLISGNQAPGHLVEGPWAAALSERLDRAVRLVRLDGPGLGHDRARYGAGATLLSLASLERMAEEAGVATVDPRRFRMLIGIDGATPHEEDSWIGKRVRVGGAVVVPGGNVGRCVVTTRLPGSVETDLDTLEVLAGYRRDLPTSEPLAFGIWARVERPGRVALGDEIALMED